MRNKRGKDFVDDLRNLCFTYGVSFVQLERIVKKLKNGDFPASLANQEVEEELGGQDWWGDIWNKVKKKIF